MLFSRSTSSNVSYETLEDVEREKSKLSSIIEVRELNSNADVILVHSKLHIDKDFLENIPNAKLIITSTSGYEHLNLSLLQSRGIRAARMPLLRRDAVVESTINRRLNNSIST